MIDERLRLIYEIYYVFARMFKYTPEETRKLPMSYIMFVMEKLREEGRELVVSEVVQEWLRQ